jgi:hypothetical protein
MPVVMIGNFGVDKEGVRTYRINATRKEDLYNLIKECRDMGWRFWDTPNIQQVHKTYSVLLKIYDPKEKGYPDESQ